VKKVFRNRLAATRISLDWLSSYQNLIAMLIPAFYAFLLASDWWFLRITGVGDGGITTARKYKDLESIIYGSKCFRSNFLGIYNQTGTRECAVSFNYGVLLAFLLAFTGVCYLNIYFLGTLAMIISVSGVIYHARRMLAHPEVSKPIVFFSLISPGFWLLFERANFDFLMLMLLLIAVVLLERGRTILALLLIACTTLMKFYTFPVLIIFLIIKWKSIRTWLGCVIALGVFGIIIWNLQLIKAGFIYTWYISFGLPIWGQWTNLIIKHKIIDISPIDLKISYLIGTALFIIVFGYNLWKNETQHKTLPTVVIINNRYIYYSFIIFGSCFVGCYSFGLNFDYRLVYLAFAVPFFGLAIKSRVREIRIINVFSLLSIWFSCFSFGLPMAAQTILQFFGDILLAVIAPTYLFYICLIIYRENVTVRKIVDILRNSNLYSTLFATSSQR
jgi:hypothetical protein